MGLFGKKKGLVVVDIGSSAVKAVELKVGGKARLVCPAPLAYGDRGAGSDIPPGATLAAHAGVYSNPGETIYTLRVRDDGSGFVYSQKRPLDAGRPETDCFRFTQARLHRLGTDPARDPHARCQRRHRLCL